MNNNSTVKKCKECGIDKDVEEFSFANKDKGTRQAKCKACVSIFMKAYNETNIEKNRARAKKWAEENIELNRERANKWRDENLERARAHDRERSKTEIRKASKRKQYKSNPELHKDNARTWRTSNPNKRKAICHNYRARKKNLPDTFTEKDWLLALEYFNHACAVCGKKFESTKDTHADHWIPLTSEKCPGTTPGNIVPLCLHCNTSKNDGDAMSFLTREFGVGGREVFIRVLDYLLYL